MLPDIRILYGILAYVEANAAGIIIDFAAVDGHFVAAAVAAI